MRRRLCVEKHKHRLVVEDVTIKDAGIYKCVFEDSCTTCTVTVEERQTLTEFIQTLSDICIEENYGSASFQCKINKESEDVKWYHGSQVLTPSEKYQLVDEGLVHILKILNVTDTDEGMYHIVADGQISSAMLSIEDTEEERELIRQYLAEKCISEHKQTSERDPVPAPKTRAEENISYAQDLKRMGATICVAVNERQGKHKKELTVEKGEVLQVLKNSRNWWKLQNYQGKAGYAPYTILKDYQPRDEFYYGGGGQYVSGYYNSFMNGGAPPAPPLPAANRSGSCGDTEKERDLIRQLLAEKSDIYVAIYDRKGKNAMELTVERGEKLQVLDKSRNWWKLKNYKGETGYAPYTILKQYQAKEDFYYGGCGQHVSEYYKYMSGGALPAPPPPAANRSASRGDTEEERHLAEKSDIYVAVHDRKGRNAKELTVESGEKLQVLDRSRNWWKLRNYKGETGYAPYTILKEYQPKEDFYYERGYTCIDAVQPTR